MKNQDNMAFRILVLAAMVSMVVGHGRVTQPASRASAWRENFNTPANYDDDGLNCGGFSTQWESNGGKCGLCGDAYDMPEPRPHELGGAYGKGVITAKYLSGTTITTTTQLTASHLGYWEFKLCPDPTTNDQACFDKHVLQMENGETKYYPTRGSTTYHVNYKLPRGLICNHCVLQWRYVAGNNWGICPDETTGLGCGRQEEFRACSDVTILSNTLNEEVNEIPPSLFFYLKNGYFDKQQGLLHLLKGPEKSPRPHRPSRPSKPSHRQPRPARYKKRRKQKTSRSKKRKKTQYWN